MQPNNDSEIANNMKLFMALVRILPFHNTPINKPDNEPNNASNAIHSAGNAVIIALVIAGAAYVTNKPEKKVDNNNHF